MMGVIGLHYARLSQTFMPALTTLTSGCLTDKRICRPPSVHPLTTIRSYKE